LGEVKVGKSEVLTSVVKLSEV